MMKREGKLRKLFLKANIVEVGGEGSAIEKANLEEKSGLANKNRCW